MKNATKKIHDETKQVRLRTVEGDKNVSSINRMYRIKKWQYVFYKHVILHGLNISMAFPQSSDSYYDQVLPITFQWRVFWLALNASYVMEFFLQSLVKRKVLSHGLMITLQWLLMVSSSLAAIGAVLGRIRYEAVVVSLLLNFLNRHHDVCNTMITYLVVGAMPVLFNR